MLTRDDLDALRAMLRDELSTYTRPPVTEPPPGDPWVALLRVALEGRDEVTAREVPGLLGLDGDEVTQAASQRAGRALSALGWSRGQRRVPGTHGAREWAYRRA